MSHRVVPSLPLGHGFSLVYRHTFIQWPHNQDRVKNASIQESFKTLCKIRCMKWSPILVTSHRILQLTFIAAHMHLINGSQNCVLNLIMYKEEELTPYVKVAAKKTNFVKLNLDCCCVFRNILIFEATFIFRSSLLLSILVHTQTLWIGPK